MKVTIDVHEPAEVKAALGAVAGCELDSYELPYGDFLVAEGACIERKTTSDLASSILDGRFISQARLLSDAYPRTFWIIEGETRNLYSQIRSEALVGALSYLAAILGSTVVWTGSLAETALMVTTIARHLQEGLGYVPNLRPGNPKALDGFAEFVVSGLPSIGGAKAKELLRSFGTPRAVFNATVDELTKVKGISARIAADIERVLTLKP